MLGLTAPNTTTESRNGRRREPRSLPDKQWPARGAIAVMRRRDSRLRRLLVAITLASLVMIGFTAAAANPGALDTRFGRGGKVIRALGPYTDLANAVALQRDGRIVVAGISQRRKSRRSTTFALLRLRKNGNRDRRFGRRGQTTTRCGQSSGAWDVAIQPNGKIVAAGYCLVTGHLRFAVIRYTRRGQRDRHFGQRGRATAAFGAHDAYGAALALQSDGKIVVAGTSVQGQDHSWLALARFRRSGRLDRSFGTRGRREIPIGVQLAEAFAVARQPDGKIVIAGDTFHFLSEGDLATAPTAFALARVDSDGGLDPTFGAGGIVTTKVGSEHPAFGPAAYALALQPDGKILAAGVAFHQTTSPFREWNDFALVRYRVDGSLDPSFGNAGEATTGFGPGYSSQAMALAIDGSGRIIAVGSAQPIDREQRFALARYQPDGALDSRFGHRGALTTKLGLFAYGHDLAQQPNGKVIVAGIADTASGKERFALARYLSGR